MIVYTMLVDCDTCENEESFTGATPSACRDAARQARWLLKRDGVHATCSRCRDQSRSPAVGAPSSPGVSGNGAGGIQRSKTGGKNR